MAKPKALTDQTPEEYMSEKLTGYPEGGKFNKLVNKTKETGGKWLDEMKDKAHAASGDDYVKLTEGYMTVKQIDEMLKTALRRYTCLFVVDDDNRLVWANWDPKEFDEHFYHDKLGGHIDTCHPKIPRVQKNVQTVIHAMRENKAKSLQAPDFLNTRDHFLIHHWDRMETKDGKYMGIYEYVEDIWLIVKYYLETTGQKLVDDPDATTGATYNKDVDARTAASKRMNDDANKDAKEMGVTDKFDAFKGSKVDANSGASDKTDASSGASKK